MAKGEALRQDKTIEKIVKVKYNYLFMPVMYCSRITLSIKRACKDIL